jgi:hypothetical protein
VRRRSRLARNLRSRSRKPPSNGPSSGSTPPGPGPKLRTPSAMMTSSAPQRMRSTRHPAPPPSWPVPPRQRRPRRPHSRNSGPHRPSQSQRLAAFNRPRRNRCSPKHARNRRADHRPFKPLRHPRRPPSRIKERAHPRPNLRQVRIPRKSRPLNSPNSKPARRYRPRNRSHPPPPPPSHPHRLPPSLQRSNPLPPPAKRRLPPASRLCLIHPPGSA